MANAYAHQKKYAEALAMLKRTAERVERAKTMLAKCNTTHVRGNGEVFIKNSHLQMTKASLDELAERVTSAKYTCTAQRLFTEQDKLDEKKKEKSGDLGYSVYILL